MTSEKPMTKPSPARKAEHPEESLFHLAVDAVTDFAIFLVDLNGHNIRKRASADSAARRGIVGRRESKAITKSAFLRHAARLLPAFARCSTRPFV
jgi:hypothetical protein